MYYITIYSNVSFYFTCLFCVYFVFTLYLFCVYFLQMARDVAEDMRNEKIVQLKTKLEEEKVSFEVYKVNVSIERYIEI